MTYKVYSQLFQIYLEGLFSFYSDLFKTFIVDLFSIYLRFIVGFIHGLFNFCFERRVLQLPVIPKDLAIAGKFRAHLRKSAQQKTLHPGFFLLHFCNRSHFSFAECFSAFLLFHQLRRIILEMGAFLLLGTQRKSKAPSAQQKKGTWM